jgi:hypothetical protein
MHGTNSNVKFVDAQQVNIINLYYRHYLSTSATP